MRLVCRRLGIQRPFPRILDTERRSQYQRVFQAALP